MATSKPGSSNDNHSKGTGSGGKVPGSANKGSMYNQKYNDGEASKQAGIKSGAFNGTVNSVKRPTQG